MSFAVVAIYRVSICRGLGYQLKRLAG